MANSSSQNPFPLSSLTAISPVDGRYRSKVASLSDYFSEFALIRYRVIVEIRWLQQLAGHPQISEAPAISAAGNAMLESMISNFSEADAARVTFAAGASPRMTDLQKAFRDQQVEVEIRRPHPLSIIFRRAGAVPVDQMVATGLERLATS